MASGLSALANNISNSVEALAADLGLIKSKKKAALHPEFPAILNQITQANWNKTMSYSFAVVGPGDIPFGEFVLPLNPSDLDQDENPAIAFKKTQGGTVVQHGGNRYKDLVIKGTTGKAPFAGAGGVQASTGKAIFQPNDLKYKSGYEVFLTLRNWFKAYYQWKNTDQTPTAKLAKMVFRNFKDGEFLVVELTKFSLRRSAQRKFLYDYTLTFQVLSHLQFKPEDGAQGFLAKADAFIQDAKDKIDTARGVFYRSQDILRQIEGTYESTVLEPLRKIALATKAFLGVGNVAADMGKQIVSNTVTEAASLGILLGISKKTDLPTKDKTLIAQALQRAQNQSRVGASSPATSRQVTNLFDKSDVLLKVDASAMPEASQLALAEDIKNAQALPRSFYLDTIEALKRVRDNASDKFNLGSGTYDTQYGRVATVTADPTKIASDAEIDVLESFTTAIKGIENLLASNPFFSGSYEDRIQDIQDKFSDSLPIKAEKAVKQVVLPTDTDLERLALQQLGDPGRWIEIAELNNLKPPYIVQDLSGTETDVLRPGDKILIPAPIVNGFGTTPRGKPTYFTENLSEIEKNLGVDFQVDENFDLILSNRGDLELAVGTENAAQAIMLKLMYEQGDLIKHPTIGVGIEPGNKFPTFSDIKLSLVRSLTQDPRFEAVENLDIIRKSSALYLHFEVKLKNVDIPVPVTVRL